MIDHDALRQSVAAYALDSLGGHERTRVQAELLDHLPGCEECTSLLRDLRETVADLAIAAPPMRPSEGLEERVLAAIRDAGGGGSVAPVVTVTRRRRFVVRVGAVAASLALVASLAVSGTLLGSLQRERDFRERMSAALAIAGDPTARVATLQGKGGSILVAVRRDGRVAMIAQDVPAAPQGRVFELWLFSGDKPVPVAAFTPRDGDAVMLTSVAEADYTVAAVTYEREFVPAPTSDPVYQGRI